MPTHSSKCKQSCHSPNGCCYEGQCMTCQRAFNLLMKDDPAAALGSIVAVIAFILLFLLLIIALIVGAAALF